SIENMENLEDSFNVDNPPSMENLSIAEEVVDLNSMEGVTFTERENTHPIVQASKCAKCSQEISTQPSEPLVTFPCCKHIVHFECIEINRKLCPKCPTNYDLEKEGFYISPEIPRKRRRQEGEQKSTRGSRHKPLFPTTA
ncbi:17718_t:CDS:2, partial [Funneliformis geosporum]